MRSYAKSLEWYWRAKKVTPGASQTMSKQPTKFPLGAYPAFIERGKGSHVWDMDRNGYIDWICSLAAVTLGHGHREVNLAVAEQLYKGTLFSLPHHLEAIVAERLCTIIPCAEMVSFIKTGSEATEAAIRVARAFTGRDVIVTVGAGYHSWHSWFSAVKPEHPGVPFDYEFLVRSFTYNDLPSLAAALTSYTDEIEEDVLSDKVAAVILEPTLLTPPAPGFLEGVRDLAHAHGALLIFDEIVTGFRWARAGGQEYFGVTPDLATFGKGMANGFPLACLVGWRDIMRHADLVSGTFGGDLIGLAACNATLDVYEREPVIEHLWKIGTAFRDGLTALIQKHGLPARIVGYGVHPKLKWEYRDEFPITADDATSLMSLFLQETAERGVMLHPGGWNVSYAHTEQDVAESLAACDAAFGICAEALADGRIKERLRGNVIQAGFQVRT